MSSRRKLREGEELQYLTYRLLHKLGILDQVM